MEINYWGYVYPTFYALPHLRNAKGTIISISSLACTPMPCYSLTRNSAKNPTPRRCAYAASKAAVNGKYLCDSISYLLQAFFDCLRLEEPSIQITTVCPGFIMTELHDKAFVPTSKTLERYWSSMANG
jgi:NAD(P)-dependent dehydrogenase (short-subunit alcohol dehydrogenase family)